jgi:hypothetical protein
MICIIHAAQEICAWSSFRQFAGGYLSHIVQLTPLRIVWNDRREGLPFLPVFPWFPLRRGTRGKAMFVSLDFTAQGFEPGLAVILPPPDPPTEG